MHSLGNILDDKTLYRVNAKKLDNNNSIELPPEIAGLNDGPDYWRNAKRNRYKKLIREGHLKDLLELAAMAKTKRLPSHWFAKFASKAEWDRTLRFLAEARKIAQTAAEVIKRLNVRPEQLKTVYKACWRFKDAVIQKAVIAEEIVAEKGGNSLRLFNYLCWKT